MKSSMNSKFVYLDLSKNPLGHSGIQEICSSLRNSIGIVHLDLSSVCMTDKSAVMLFETLHQNVYLTSLSLASKDKYRNQLTQKSWDALGSLLQINQIL